MESRRRIPANLDDLARHVDLSKGSVSRILNGKGAAFSEATRRRVVAAAEEIGYRPSPVAKALARGRTGVVSLCLSGEITPFLAQVSREYHRCGADQGWSTLVNVFEGGPSGGHPEALLGVADGIILHDASEQMWSVDALVDALQPRRTGALPPLVTSGAFGTRPEFDRVQVDLEPAAIDAVRHLVDGDRRRILYLCTAPGASDDGRRTGYLRVMADAGRAPEILASVSQNRQSFRQQLRDYIEAQGEPNAVFCHNDNVALAAFWALYDLGRRVPDDVALVGCDGIEDLDYLPCPIPTIVQPLRDVAATAVAFLDRRLKDPTQPVQNATLSATFRLPEERR